MEKLSSILDSLKERLTNPFIFSFILAWLTYNWQVPIALFWLSDDQLYAKGYTNLIDFLSVTVTGKDTWLWPIGVACFYTFIVPLLMILMRMFNAWVVKVSNGQVFKISKESYVSFEKYVELRNRYKSSTDQVGEMLNTETERSKLHQKTQQDLADAQSKLVAIESEYQSQITTLRNENQTQIINNNQTTNATLAQQTADYSRKISELTNQLNLVNEERRIERDVKIINGTWYMNNVEVAIIGRKFENNGQIGTIENFLFLRDTSQIMFSVVYDNSGQLEGTSFYKLTRTTPDLLQGYVDKTQVTFERKAPDIQLKKK